jgi:hypothetical protein
MQRRFFLFMQRDGKNERSDEQEKERYVPHELKNVHTEPRERARDPLCTVFELT